MRKLFQVEEHIFINTNTIESIVDLSKLPKTHLDYEKRLIITMYSGEKHELYGEANIEYFYKNYFPEIQ
jgi:hypothetical protein